MRLHYVAYSAVWKAPPTPQKVGTHWSIVSHEQYNERIQSTSPSPSFYYWIPFTLSIRLIPSAATSQNSFGMSLTTVTVIMALTRIIIQPACMDLFNKYRLCATDWGSVHWRTAWWILGTDIQHSGKWLLTKTRYIIYYKYAVYSGTCIHNSQY